MCDAAGHSPPLHPHRLTWAALLGQWVDFARSALALPDDEAGRRLRESVPDIIALQAVWFALRHMDELAPDERALGLDRAQVMIDTHAAALERRWPGEAMPDALVELVKEARDGWAEAARVRRDEPV